MRSRNRGILRNREGSGRTINYLTLLPRVCGHLVFIIGKNSAVQGFHRSSMHDSCIIMHVISVIFNPIIFI